MARCGAGRSATAALLGVMRSDDQVLAEIDPTFGQVQRPERVTVEDGCPEWLGRPLSRSSVDMNNVPIARGAMATPADKRDGAQQHRGDGRPAGGVCCEIGWDPCAASEHRKIRLVQSK